MINVIKGVIESGDFELKDILKKIDTCWVKGNLTDEDCKELSELAQRNANPENSVDIMKKFEEFEQRIKALESKSETSNETTEEYPEYVPSKWYYNGDKTTFEGNRYKCTAPEGEVCVWSPKEYPTYWQLITE